jgi:molybdate transport system substrate-binding protein
LIRRALLVACCALLGGGAAAPAARAPQPLTIFAAASLTDVLPAIAPADDYAFAGSNALAAQIAEGAPADVFAAANTAIPERLYARRLVEKPVVFTRNALVVVVPRANPARIASVDDLARRGVSVVVAAPSVPVGGYTQTVLRRLGLAARVDANVVSRELDVRSVLAKVTLGQADAGFVYATDARTERGKVRVVRIPASAQPSVAYAVAVVSASRHKAAARAFVARLLGKAGQATLARFGFLPPTHGT